MSDDLTATADRILEETLERTGARDPREFYRERLRELKKADAERYEKAVAYYRDTLIPAVASEEVDALEAWTEYGRFLAQALAPGRTVEVDATGRAHTSEGTPAPGRLVLHVPDEKRARMLLVALPPELSPAQRATYDVLVGGKRELGR